MNFTEGENNGRQSSTDQEISESPPLRHAHQHLHHAGRRQGTGAAHEDFQVVDAKTGDDLTRSILLQIILEEEAGGAPMFTSDLLAQMIRFYGNAMQGMMGKYLESNIKAFTDMQAKLQDQAKALYGDNDRREPGSVGAVPQLPGPGDAGA